MFAFPSSGGSAASVEFPEVTHRHAITVFEQALRIVWTLPAATPCDRLYRFAGGDEHLSDFGKLALDDCRVDRSVLQFAEAAIRQGS